MCITRSVAVTDRLHTTRERFDGRYSFACPIAMQVNQVRVIAINGQITAVIPLQPHRFLLAVHDLIPRLGDVHCFPLAHMDGHKEGLHQIFGLDHHLFILRMVDIACVLRP